MKQPQAFKQSKRRLPQLHTHTQHIHAHTRTYTRATYNARTLKLVLEVRAARSLQRHRIGFVHDGLGLVAIRVLIDALLVMNRVGIL